MSEQGEPSPNSFRWGVGIEGSAIPQLDVDQFAWTGHDERWASDLRALRELGPIWLRYPLRWHKIQPTPRTWSWSEVDDRLGLAAALGFHVVPDLIHFGTPPWLTNAFGDPDFPLALERFAARFAERCGGLVAAYCPINEPLVTALFSGDLGLWPPHGEGWRDYMPVLSRVAQGLCRATAAIRRADAEAEIWFVEAVEHHRTCDPSLDEDVTRRNQRRFLALDLVSGRVDQDHPLADWLLFHGFSRYDLEWLREHPESPTYLGLDYYAHSEIEVWQDEGLVRSRVAQSPLGFSGIAATYHQRYGWPILLTETSTTGRVEDRSAWLNGIVSEISKARRNGIPVHGLIWWPAFDHIDWDGALLHQSGHVHPAGLWRLRRTGEGKFRLDKTHLADVFASLVANGNGAIAPEAPAGARTSNNGSSAGAAVRPAGFPIVVHSHLRWSFVWQRPQQTHSRLAGRHPVLFIEEPEWIERGQEPRLELSTPWPNIQVLKPLLPRPLMDSRAKAGEIIQARLRERLQRELSPFRESVHWLYTPLMLDQLKAFGPPLSVVYDCMDELSRFAFAAHDLPEREERLLERADVVFTGGYRLYEAKSARHLNVHAFGCGVDFSHFRANGSAVAPPDIGFIPRPRLVYVGVVDERLDYLLLRELAAQRGDWSLMIIGPVVKVDPAALPRGRNIYWLGSRSYESLPGYLHAADVCLMPFALNEATEFINPTKTLEYLATGKPVVSTPVHDVARQFSEVVRIAPREEFVGAVDDVLRAPHDPEPGRNLARAHSWERVVAEMEGLVVASMKRRNAPAVVNSLASGIR